MSRALPGNTPADSSAWRQQPPGGKPGRKDDNIRKAATDRAFNLSANRRYVRL
jgi:hypothetical protein